MADELSFIPEDTGGGVIGIAKKIALEKAAQIAKEALQTVDKTGVITSQLTEGDLIEIGTGIQEGDKDKIKNVIGVNLEKIHSSIPEATLMAAGINLAQPEMLAMNITNQLVQTGGAVVEGLAGLDLGDNIFSKGAEGVFDVADIIANNPQYGITPNLANMVSGINRTYGNVIGRPLGWAGQKMYDFTSPFFDLLGSPFQTGTADIIEEPIVDTLPFAASDPVADPVFTDEADVPYYTGDTGGSYGGGEDFGPPAVPVVTPRPTMADVAGPVTLTNNDINQIINDQIQLTGGGGNTGQTLGPVGMGFVPPSPKPKPRPRPHHALAQGGLVSMARVLRR